MRRFNISLKQAAADNLKAVAESKESPYDAELLRLFNASLLRAAEDNLIKAGFNPAQQRDPAGAPTGGQWSGAGGGSGQPLPTRRPPNLGRSRTPDEPGLGHPLSPLDFIGGGVVRALRPVASEIVGGVTAARNAMRLRFSGVPKEILTDHGGIRVGERAVYSKEVEEAIRTAKETGNITTKLGKYRTPQHRYHGSNGLTVIIETEGRNAGKIITTYRRKPGGK
jgi:hypothetical protein